MHCKGREGFRWKRAAGDDACPWSPSDELVSNLTPAVLVSLARARAPLPSVCRRGMSRVGDEQWRSLIEVKLGVAPPASDKSRVLSLVFTMENREDRTSTAILVHTSRILQLD